MSRPKNTPRPPTAEEQADALPWPKPAEGIDLPDGEYMTIRSAGNSQGGLSLYTVDTVFVKGGVPCAFTRGEKEIFNECQNRLNLLITGRLRAEGIL